GASTHQPPPAASASPAGWGRLPIYFVENHGQADPRIGYYAHPRGGTAYFRADGVTFGLMGPPVTETGLDQQDAHVHPAAEPALRGRWLVNVDFLGADPAARLEGREQTEAVFSYFKGRPDQWQTGLPTYRGVSYLGVWPGIDLTYVGERDHLKYELVVRPG